MSTELIVSILPRPHLPPLSLAGRPTTICDPWAWSRRAQLESLATLRVPGDLPAGVVPDSGSQPAALHGWAMLQSPGAPSPEAAPLRQGPATAPKAGPETGPGNGSAEPMDDSDEEGMVKQEGDDTSVLRLGESPGDSPGCGMKGMERGLKHGGWSQAWRVESGMESKILFETALTLEYRSNSLIPSFSCLTLHAIRDVAMCTEFPSFSAPCSSVRCFFYTLSFSSFFP